MTPEQREALIAEWGEAVYLAREDYTVDPHQHIERLALRGDHLADALRALLVEQPAVERTCGTCHHFEALARPERGWCHVYEAKRYIDDGCIKGWTPRQTETTP